MAIGCSVPTGQVAALREPYFGAEGREMASSVCARGDQLQRYVEHPSSPSGGMDFNLTDEGRGKGKLGYLANGVGKSIGFCLPWPSPGEMVTHRPPSVLWIGFLRSYEHMGRAGVSCVRGCSCEPQVVDGHAVSMLRNVSTFAEHVFKAFMSTRGRACVLALRVLNTSSSGAHKFKVRDVTILAAD